MSLLPWLRDQVSMRTMGKHKARFMRGWSYFGLFLSLWNAATLLIIILDKYGVVLSGTVTTLLLVYGGGSAGFLVLCYAGGYWDEKKGLWPHENNYAFDVTPESMTMKNNCQASADNTALLLAEVRALHTEVQELKTKQPRKDQP